MSGVFLIVLHFYDADRRRRAADEGARVRPMPPAQKLLLALAWPYLMFAYDW